jgi:hypothetical protein
MRITSFRIENFRNIRLAECSDPSNFMVLCGGNGCGKSSILDALIIAKEIARSYYMLQVDSRLVSADASQAKIALTLAFDEPERVWAAQRYAATRVDVAELVAVIDRGGQARLEQSSHPILDLLGVYDSQVDQPLGYFDYFEPQRIYPRVDLSSWEPGSLNDTNMKQTLAARGVTKFQHTKRFLASLKMRDLQALQRSIRDGRPEVPDSLAEFRVFFDEFFAPMRFIDVQIDSSPFQFIIATPRGEIDIDDLSSGEKEVLNVFARFYQLKPRGSIILMDEADAHLHPDLARRYLAVLRRIGQDNQLWLTTHSPEMMMAAGSDALYTVLKTPPSEGGNQLVRVTQNQQLHEVLSEIMGARGLVSINQRIIFIEGDDASADRAIYEACYPPGQYQVTFIPAGNSATVRKTAERVNSLLTMATGYQQFYSIVDRDIDRAEADPTNGTRLFRLPFYHIENVLLEENAILSTTMMMLGRKCPYQNPTQVADTLKQLVLDDSHLHSYSRAILDARLASCAKAAYDSVYQRSRIAQETGKIPTFEECQQEARTHLQSALLNDRWKAEAKGRDLIRAYCHRLGINYEHFRNSLIACLAKPPSGLAEIMNQILAD